MQYLEALNLLCQPIRAGDLPRSLQPMQALSNAMGQPHKGIPAIVVAGSTGKGTTCHHIARLLRANGLNVGLYTSPHLHSFRERFFYNDEMITEDEFTAGFEAVHAAAHSLNHIYSTFEQATALALWWFGQKRPDILVLEIGLGGRFDAVNIVDNILAVFTRIENEHMAMLGGSRQSIAWHKAGIMRRGGHAVTVKQAPDIFRVLQSDARMLSVNLHLDGGCNFSRESREALLALAAWQNLLERGVIPRCRFLPGLSFNSLPGRMEPIKVGERTVLVDGGHTADSARRLRTEIARLAGPVKPVRVIVGMLSDKVANEYLKQFDSPRFHMVFTQAPGHRGMSAEKLFEQIDYRYATVEIAPLLEDALAEVADADEALVVVAGSLRMAAGTREYFGLLPATVLAEAQATRSIFDGLPYLARLQSPTAQTVSAPPAK